MSLSAGLSGDPAERSWDLSLYELHRTPQEALTEAGVEIAVSARSLQSELTCPICLDMLTQTMTTKECLHRCAAMGDTLTEPHDFDTIKICRGL